MNKPLIAVLSVLGVIAVVSLITIGILATNVETFEPVRGTDCINVEYKENHPFSPDRNYSGLYCPAK